MPKLKHDILNDVVMDDEFKEIVEKHKEIELSDVEKDLKIQADKVIYVINRTIARLSMVAHLPLFLDDDAAILRDYLKPIEVFFIKDVLGKFGANCGHSYNSLLDEYASILENTHQKLALNAAKSMRASSTDSSLTEIVAVTDLYVSNLIDILFKNNCLREIVYSKNSDKVDRGIMKIINALQEFKEMAKIKLYITGEDEAEMDKELREAYNTSALLAASINELKETLEKQRKEMGEQLNKKVDVFQMYNQKMENIKNEFDETLKRILVTSEETMMEKSAASEGNQAILAEEAKRITNQYNALLEENLKLEKQARSRRYKIETQLQNWLTKFDQDMGDRQAEYEALEKQYNEEKAAMDELREMYDEQEEEYVRLMKEKTLEQERIDNEIAIHFLLNHAARKIQRCWRAYWERKLARRKARKGKGKGKGKAGKAAKAKSPTTDAPRPDVPPPVDPNVALLEKNKKFKSDVFDEIKDPNAFDAKVEVEL